MKRFFPVMLTGILLSVLCGLSAVAQETQGPKIVLREQVFDFKEIKEGQIIEHAFQVFNQGDQPLKIIKVNPG